MTFASRLVFILCMMLHLAVVSQVQLTGLSMRWDDDPTEWLIYTRDSTLEGSIKVRWTTPLRWNEWDINIGDKYGTIEAKWPRQLNEWTLRMEGTVVTFRAMWQNDFSEWTIVDNQYRLIFKTKWNRDTEVWKIRDERFGYFDVYTVWEGDIRDWTIEDGLEAQISSAAKLAMAFIALLSNLPIN